MFSDNYKSPACESGKGNLSVDVMSHTLTGAEAADTVIRMRSMSEYNSYLRITAIADSGMVGTVDVGYVSRDDNQSDDLDYFAAGIDLSTANQAVISDVVQIDFKHDLAMTIRTNNSGNADHVVKLVVEFINVAG